MAEDKQQGQPAAINPDGPGPAAPTSESEIATAVRHRAEQIPGEQAHQERENAATARRRELDKGFDHQPIAGHGDEGRER